MKQPDTQTYKGQQPRRYPEHHTSVSQRLNWIRASVLGANDGIVSIAGLVVGVAGATTDRRIIIMSGLAGVVAGALSMAVGEYVSVSSQRDTERALIEQERHEHTHFPDEEFEELAGLYQAKGLSAATAKQVAKELSEKDALAAHLDAEHNLDADDLTNPWHAAIASALSFLSGAIIPLVAAVISPPPLRVPLTFIAVILALVGTGTISAHMGGASKKHATLRVVVGGLLAMAITYGIGRVVGISV